ncbi:MAG TPA: hypothetical protein VHP38_04745 [Ruminiclostridium sp.]|nr:hypothetical protein [Ruminiclostridium sp.]
MADKILKMTDLFHYPQDFMGKCSFTLNTYNGIIIMKWILFGNDIFERSSRMSPILKAVLPMLFIISGLILLIIGIKFTSIILLAVSIILSIVGAFFAAVGIGLILKKQ